MIDKVFFIIICVEPSLLSWNETKLIMMSDDSDKSLNSVSQYFFFDNFCVNSNQRDWCVILVYFSALSLADFGIWIILAL